MLKNLVETINKSLHVQRELYESCQGDSHPFFSSGALFIPGFASTDNEPVSLSFLGLHPQVCE